MKCCRVSDSTVR